MRAPDRRVPNYELLRAFDSDEVLTRISYGVALELGSFAVSATRSASVAKPTQRVRH